MSSPPVLALEQLVVRYGQRVVVDRLDLQLHTGELVGLIGPNGAGKSSTLRVLMGMTPPASGRLLLHGRDVTHAPDLARGTIGSVPQDVALFDELTAAETLTLAGSLRGLQGDALNAEVERWLELTDLKRVHNAASRYYSGGMRRKLAVGAALIGDPAVIVLDESFAGLDPESTWAMEQELLRHRARGAALILCTHLLDFLDRSADRVLLLNEGRASRTLIRQTSGDLDLEGEPNLTTWYLAQVRQARA